METPIVLVLAFLISTNRAAAGDEDSCFKPLGSCYGDGPLQSLTRPVPNPDCPEIVNTVFYFDGEKTVAFRANSTDLPPGFDCNATTKVFIHGWISTGNETWLKTATQYYKEKYQGKVNCIRVDWSGGANTLNYFAAVSNQVVAGAETCRLINLLYEKCGSCCKIHLIGHSLGAHVAGQAAKEANCTVARATGLDAAQPFYEGEPESVRLDKSDAHYVDAIHTSARPLATGGLGYIAPYANADYYPNGGGSQPGCPVTPLLSLPFVLTDLQNITTDVKQSIFCSHVKSIGYFLETIISKFKMWACQGSKTEAYIKGLSTVVPLPENFSTKLSKMCDKCTLNTCSPMGSPSQCYPARGAFVLATNWLRPYTIPDPATDKQMENDLKKSGYKDNCTTCIW